MKKPDLKVKLHQRRRQKYELKHRRIYNLWKKRYNLEGFGVSSKSIKWKRKLEESYRIKAPKRFSLTENANETLEFINELKSIGKKHKKIHIKLNHIDIIKQGAIAMLLSVIGELAEKGVKVSGDYPKNKEAKRTLEQSGFFTYVQGMVDDENKNPINTILTKGKDIVNPSQSSEIVTNAMRIVWGHPYRNQALQGLLIELMANTVNHAFPQDKHRKWWLSVNYEKSENKVSFVFVDNGVGIINTLYLKFRKKIESIFKTDVDLLLSSFKGEIGSRTQLINRGRGLPSIYKKQKLGHVKNMKIITNRVFLDFQNENQKLLKNSFSGTYYYWEIDLTCTQWKNI